MPLIDDNRVFVAQGLNIFKNESRILSQGLIELLKAVQLLNKPVTEQDLAFSLCPAVNAAGRLGEAFKAYDAITEREPLEAAKKAFELKQINEKRKELSKHAMDVLLR